MIRAAISRAVAKTHDRRIGLVQAMAAQQILVLKLVTSFAILRSPPNTNQLSRQYSRSSSMSSIKRALISVSDKSGIVEMAKGLETLGAEILSTGGTAKTLREAGIKVTDVAAYTGSPEILDGRVKTLHPKIHGGLLGRRSLPAHVEQMKQHNIGPIDVVVVNLYPFESTISKPNCHFDDAIENIDIGGPSM
ncbi:MAG TPA: hypothetical protein VIU63_09485, partial [Nitrospira sp.]